MTVVELSDLVTPERFRAAFAGPGVFVLEDDAQCLMSAEPTEIIRVDRRDGGDPFEPLRRALSTVAGGPASRSPFPFPFRAGLVGYVGYECGQLLERMPNRARTSLGLPDLAFGLHRWVIGTRGGKSWLATLDEPGHVLERLASGGTERARPAHAGRRAEPRAWLSREEYLARVATAKEHILSGDAFEICLTTAFDVPFERAEAWALFRALRRRNPAPFAAFLELPEATIVSSSPERFLSLDGDRVAETRPIKGTRPRGTTPEEDARLREELRASEKDRAENAMIVDLSRNDLGRVCEVGSITAPDLYAVESYATVHQLVSTVRGKLAPQRDALDLLRAAFPPGSMTGAPKIEAMRILEALEPVERGIYSGALGWIDASGTMDLSVVIRTAICANGLARFHAGGAVTADSDPAAEYAEMQQKTRALREALG
ncbi:MAG: aminodeoxychorismate synthase component I [Labilithrix sp.]